MVMVVQATFMQFEQHLDDMVVQYARVLYAGYQRIQPTLTVRSHRIGSRLIQRGENRLNKCQQYVQVAEQVSAELGVGSVIAGKQTANVIVLVHREVASEGGVLHVKLEF